MFVSSDYDGNEEKKNKQEKTEKSVFFQRSKESDSLRKTGSWYGEGGIFRFVFNAELSSPVAGRVG